MASTTTDRRFGVNAGVSFKAPCKGATTSNVTLSGEQTIDSVSFVSGDRILVKNQTTSSENGIYVVDTGAWSRAKDFDGFYDVVQGTLVSVISGSSNANTSWRVTTSGSVVPGSSNINFSEALFSDSSILTFLQSGTGPVSRSVQDRLRDRFNIKDFGATGNGVTDERTALNNAQTSGPFFLTKGTYSIASNITITSDLHIEPGAVLKPESGVTISFESSLTADDYQIFDLSAGGLISFEKRSRIIRAAWFGFSPDATAATNQTAFNNAIAACPASNGAEILLPPGNIDTNKLTISKSGITVTGHVSGTWLINNEATDACILIGGQAGKTSWCTARGLRIGQDSSVSAAAGNCGIRILNTDQTTLKDIVCWNFPAALFEGYVFDDADNNKVENLVANNCGNNGYRFTNDSGSSCTDTFGQKLIAYSNGLNGLMFEGTSGFYVNNIHSFNNSQRGFHFSNAKADNQFFFIYGWMGDTNGEYNWLIQNLNRSSLAQCWAATQQSAAVNTFATGMLATGTAVYDVTFTGVICHNNNSHGFVATSSCINLLITGCQFTDNGQSGTGSGLRIELATDIIVNGCRCDDNATDGITLTSALSDYLMIQNNNLRGNSGASLTNSSTGANNQIGTNIT